eukprot:567355-Pelagomonas_calceolata.AAC.2
MVQPVLMLNDSRHHLMHLSMPSHPTPPPPMQAPTSFSPLKAPPHTARAAPQASPQVQMPPPTASATVKAAQAKAEAAEARVKVAEAKAEAAEAKAALAALLVDATPSIPTPTTQLPSALASPFLKESSPESMPLPLPPPPPSKLPFP